MTDKTELPLKWFDEYKLIAVIKAGSSEDAEQMIRAAIAGGFKIFEISMNTPQAIRLLETYGKKENYLFGASTITDGEMAQRAINAGAKFLSNTYTDKEIINVAKNYDIFVIQGASTPTEAFNAYQLGADLVKIYPAGFLGGPQFFRSLHNSLPFIKMTAHGGVNLENLTDYLKHSLAVSISGAIFEKTLIRQDNWTEVAERAKQFTQKLESLRVTR